MSLASDLLEPRTMDTNDHIRRRRLEQLCLQEGGVRAVAEKANMKWEALDQVLKGVLLPAKSDGTRSPRGLGDPLARKLEEAYDLGIGWFDWPFEGVDFKKWSRLDPFQRAFVQGQLDIAITEALQKTVPASVKRTAVPDKKAEQHRPRLPEKEAKSARDKASKAIAAKTTKDGQRKGKRSGH